MAQLVNAQSHYTSSPRRPRARARARAHIFLPSMPNPTTVSVARQCFTEEGARALDDAAALARRRGHPQTTSLHLLSALLAMPESALREACERVAAAWRHQRQIRLLELCVGVGLDRIPTSKSAGCSGEEQLPPVSNSLMAAVKRSQSNQRRNPESYHLQQIHYNPEQTASLLKVELKYLILSLFDDPIVSRVFGDAGYRSCDIKLAVIQPSSFTQFPPKQPRVPYRYPPIFLCNLTDSFQGRATANGLSLPFGQEDLDENCRRIGEVLLRRNEQNGKNPLLVGVPANHALKGFVDTVNSGKVGVFPREVDGMDVVCIEKDVSEFVIGRASFEMIMSKFREVESVLGRCSGPGVAVNFGDVKVLVCDHGSSEAATFIVARLTDLVKRNGEKLWLIGAATSYETYWKFLAKFPSVEKEWDLNLLPIHWKSSFVGSFVPFGGFFCPPPDPKSPVRSKNQLSTCCYLCTEKFDQEVAAILKAESTIPVAEPSSENVPSWLQKAAMDTGKSVDTAEPKDDGTRLKAKIMELQKKWNDTCQRLHQTELLPKVNIYQMRSQVPTSEVLQFIADKRASSSQDPPANKSQNANPSPGLHIDLQEVSPPRQNTSTPLPSQAEDINLQSKLPVNVSRNQQRKNDEHLLPPHPLANLASPYEHASCSSLTSVTTDLGLGTMNPTTKEEADSSKSQEHHQCLSSSISAEIDAGGSENTSHQVCQSSSCSGPLRDSKTLKKALAKKVGWQDEAIYTISQAVSYWRSGNGRQHVSDCKGGIWLTLLGPDEVGKKKVALALAEIVFGNEENLISVDLSSEYGVRQPNSIFDCQKFNLFDGKSRVKLPIDCIVEELGKKSNTVIFLQNVDKADIFTQGSLSKAIQTGKFPDSHGREISISSAIFVATSKIEKVNKNMLQEKEPVKFPEEIILKAKRWQMQILIGHGPDGVSVSSDKNVRVTPRKGTSNSGSVKKRKRMNTSDSPVKLQKLSDNSLRCSLDLNFPADATEEDSNSGKSDSDSTSESTEAWLENFFDLVDEKVVFKPFDFDTLADKILTEVKLQFQKRIGAEAVLEIDHEVMVEILAAAQLSNRKRVIKNWVEKVLGKSFEQVRQNYPLTTGSIVKLVAREGLPIEEFAPGICLPRVINMSSIIDV